MKNRVYERDRDRDGDRERETEKERQRDRQREIERQRETERERQRKRDRETDRERDRERETERGAKLCSYTITHLSVMFKAFHCIWLCFSQGSFYVLYVYVLKLHKVSIHHLLKYNKIRTVAVFGVL